MAAKLVPVSDPAAAPSKRRPTFTRQHRELIRDAAGDMLELAAELRVRTEGGAVSNALAVRVRQLASTVLGALDAEPVAGLVREREAGVVVTDRPVPPAAP